MSNDPREVALGRLERERQQAERRYVSALSALDVASAIPPAVTSVVAAAEADLARARQIWLKYSPGEDERGLRRMLKRLAAEAVRWLPWRRRAFQGAVLAVSARNLEATRALVDATRHFQSHVVWYAQTISGYAGAGRALDASPEGLAMLHAALNALSSDWVKEMDSLAAREGRYVAQATAAMRAVEELRDAVTLLHERTRAAAREAHPGSPGSTGSLGSTGSSGSRDVVTGDLAYRYVAFEERFRGSRAEIRARLGDYAALFAGRADVVDIGCGRGELLDLLRDAGISARGIDVNAEMVAACRERDLTVDLLDAVTFLEAQPESSLGGLVAIQVVEHLKPEYLVRLLDLAHTRLRPGSPIVLETINTACWAAFFDSYIRDFTHVRPLHPDTLKYLVQASGFTAVDVQFRSPIAEHDKLPTVRLVPPAGGAARDAAIPDLVDAINAHAERLNSQLFTHRDYAIVARR